MTQSSLSIALRKGLNISGFATSMTQINIVRQIPLVISTRQFRSHEKGRNYLNPRVVPVKFRVAPSAHVNPNYFRSKDPAKRKLKWSNEEDTHPLEDCPISDYPQLLPDGGMRYYGFTYYPRDFAEVESIPQEEVTPLFMVRRVKSYSGLEWWHKKTLTEIGLGRDSKKLSKVVIVKNVPEMNEKLYSMKHLIEITPIKLPANLPLDADPADCFLTEEGDFLYDPEMAVEDDRLLEPERMSKLKMNRIVTKEACRKRWDDAWEMTT